ncbi:MAG: potassium channel family protein [Cyanobacteria bacterium P01_A01_bin.3]
MFPASIVGPLTSIQITAVVAITFKTLVASNRKQNLYLLLAGITLGLDLVYGLLKDNSFPMSGLSGALLSGTWAVFFVFSVVLVGQSLFASSKVTLDTVMGGICIFLMLGYLWFAIYGLLMAISPDSFQGPDGALSDFDLMYFSFTTLTTVGYGEITPVTRIAKVAANLEAIVGVLFPTIFMAKLVSSYQRDKSDSDS